MIHWGGVSTRLRLVLPLAALIVLSGCYGGNLGAPVRDTASAPSHSPGVVRVVQRGDTLYSIAWDAGLDYRALARWNAISPPYVIHPGQRLRLRPEPGAAAPPRPSAPAKAAPRPVKSPAPQPRRQPEPRSTVGDSGWIWPAQGPVIRKFSRTSANPGIDIGGKAGQIVKSAAGGRVVYSGDGLRGYGELIIVKHNEMFLSAYAHNRKLLVREGDEVRRGQPIAEMGSTGTDRVKLHFEIRKEGRAVDPLQYLPKS